MRCKLRPLVRRKARAPFCLGAASERAEEPRWLPIEHRVACSGRRSRSSPAGAPTTALAHDEAASTVRGHIQEDSVPPTSPATERRLERRTKRGHRGGRQGGRGDGDRQRGPGRPVGPRCRLARGGRPRGAAREREGARLRLHRRQGSRDLPGPRSHPRHGLGPRHRHADAGERDHGLQHLLQRPGPSHGRVHVRRRREQERPARTASSRRTSSTRTPTRGASGRTWRLAAGTRASRPWATGRC